MKEGLRDLAWAHAIPHEMRTIIDDREEFDKYLKGYGAIVTYGPKNRMTVDLHGHILMLTRKKDAERMSFFQHDMIWNYIEIINTFEYWP
ncbi:MAG: hypothetical protein LBR22_06325 [Desulfovibrio sp.]|jgi:hypothetical protein|nr:hypothetical protein [Desulfovibrio sp.]